MINSIQNTAKSLGNLYKMTQNMERNSNNNLPERYNAMCNPNLTSFNIDAIRIAEEEETKRYKWKTIGMIALGVLFVGASIYANQQKSHQQGGYYNRYQFNRSKTLYSRREGR